MKIRLDLIKPSPRPVRSSWAEDKMQELTQSIKEQGLIVPIKVRPDPELKCCGFHEYGTLIDDDYEWEDSARMGECFGCGDLGEQVWPSAGPDNNYEDPDTDGPPTGIIPFEIVYGHRRVEACRRAGLGEVEAIVEGIDDTKAFIQALIENVQREDMSSVDKAKSLQNLKDMTGWSAKKISELGIFSSVRVRQLLRLLKEPEDIQQLISSPGTGLKSDTVTDMHVNAVRQVLKTEAGSDVIRKAAKEQLNRNQTREVADTVARAKDDAEREAILETEYADLVRMPQFVEAKAQAKRKAERRETKKRQEEPREVKQYIDTLRSFQAAVIEAAAVAEYGKFSPEAARFVLRKHDDLRQSLAELEEKLRKEP